MWKKRIYRFFYTQAEYMQNTRDWSKEERCMLPTYDMQLQVRYFFYHNYCLIRMSRDSPLRAKLSARPISRAEPTVWDLWMPMRRGPDSRLPSDLKSSVWVSTVHSTISPGMMELADELRTVAIPPIERVKNSSLVAGWQRSSFTLLGGLAGWGGLGDLEGLGLIAKHATWWAPSHRHTCLKKAR